MLDYPVHDAHVLGEAAATGLKTGCAADLLVGFALREGVMAAVVAIPAGDVMEHHDPVAGLELGNVLSGCDHHSGSLVAKDARSRV